MKIFIFLLHTCPSNGKHSKLKRVNRAKHKKEKKEYNFIASRRKREEYLRRFHISRKKREEKKKKKKREMLSSRNKEFVQIGLFHPPSAIVSILANLCEPLKAFHKAILFFDPQSRITRDLQEKTRWWNQGYIYNGNTYLYVEREKDFHDLHVETILRRITDKGERGKSCEITERRKGGASNGGDKVWIMKPLVRGREPEIRASLTRPRSLLDSSEFRGFSVEPLTACIEFWKNEWEKGEGRVRIIFCGDMNNVSGI